MFWNSEKSIVHIPEAKNLYCALELVLDNLTFCGQDKSVNRHRLGPDKIAIQPICFMEFFVLEPYNNPWAGRGPVTVIGLGVAMGRLLMSQLFRASAFALLCCLLSTGTVLAQNGFRSPTSIQVQLPVVSVFNIRTTVSVPDGGTMSLGGISRYSSGRRTSGVPGLGGPLFQNRGIGYSAGGSRATVKATIISNREISEDLLAEGNRRARIQERFDPNGTYAVQARADFISRNIGRSRK